MNAALLTEGDNISGEELRARGPVYWTIAGVTREEMEKIGKPGVKTKRGRVTFSDAGSKPWIVNVTNKAILVTVFGDGRCGKKGSDDEHRDGKCYQTDHWIGHRIALGHTEQRAQGVAVDGVIVVGASVLTSEMAVSVRLTGKGARSYTVRPPRKASAPAPAPAPESGAGG